jgi:hypothetical protein
MKTIISLDMHVGMILIASLLVLRAVRAIHTSALFHMMAMKTSKKYTSISPADPTLAVCTVEVPACEKSGTP